MWSMAAHCPLSCKPAGYLASLVMEPGLCQVWLPGDASHGGPGCSRQGQGLLVRGSEPPAPQGQARAASELQSLWPRPRRK